MKKDELKIVFMGTPNISAHVFEGMINEGYNFVALVSQPDRPVGRKGILEKTPTKVIAEKYNIPVFQPEKIRKDYDFIKDLKPDLIITLAYGQIVPQGLLDIPTLGCLNLHGSLLPKYRGAAPIQYALINQEKITGMTLMEMIDKMDAGKMYGFEQIIIDEEDNSTSLFIKMAEAALKLILEKLPLYIAGQLPGLEQDENLATYAPSIKSEKEHLDLNLNKEEILGWIRALSDHPGAYLYLDDAKFKIYKAKIVSDEISHQVGEITQSDKNGLTVQLSNGKISLLDVQKEGKKRMDYKSFINGNQGLLGKILK